MSSLYLLSIVILVLFSWVGSVCGLTLPNGALIPNLLSPESLRWFVRHGIDHIAASPLVELLLVLIVIGALRSSGLLSAIVSHSSMSRRQRHALIISIGLFGGELLLLVLGILPGGNLLSITGHVYGSPLAQGWLFILLLIISIPCIAYGRMSGAWTSSDSVISKLTSEISRCSSYVIICIVASQLIACVDYICLFDFLEWGDFMSILFEVIVYGMPFIVLFITNYSIYDSSSIE